MVHPHPHIKDLGGGPPDGVDELSFDVFRALMRTVRLNGKMLMRVMGEHGGHPGQAGCLWAVAAREGVSQRELADMTHLSPPAVTGMLQRLEKSGLVERRPDETDQRVTRVHLTDAGRGLNLDLHQAHGDYISKTIGTLSEADRRELARLLGLLGDNIAAAIREAHDEGSPSE